MTQYDGLYEPTFSQPSRSASPGAGHLHKTERSPCSLCRRMVQRASMRRHQRSKRCDPSALQDTEFKFRCGWDECGFETNYRHHLRGHERRWHTGERHRCARCDFETPWAQCLTKHLQSCPGPGVFCTKRKRGRLARKKRTTPKIKVEEGAGSPPPLDGWSKEPMENTAPPCSLAFSQDQNTALDDPLPDPTFFREVYTFPESYIGTAAGDDGVQFDPFLDQVLLEMGSTTAGLSMQEPQDLIAGGYETQATFSRLNTPETAFDPFYLFPEVQTKQSMTQAPSWGWSEWMFGVGKDLWGSAIPAHLPSDFVMPLLQSPEASWL